MACGISEQQNANLQIWCNVSDVVIKIESLGKRYLVGHQSAGRRSESTFREILSHSLRDLSRSAADMFKGRQIVAGDEIEAFWALKDVSFEIRRGQVVGIIGRNGAGKSTLLKILSRITEPTEGRVELNGRIASLLEVGTGFHPELTGRENIYLNGAILGMSQAEIRQKSDEIIAFAGIEKFLDTPVKRYSSGMYVRLAFAVAAHLEPEILVVDEVLAVGDADFQKKCLGKMQDVADSGRTVLLVSHNTRAISSLCTKAAVLDFGKMTFFGDVNQALSLYTNAPIGIEARTDRGGDGDLRFTDIRAHYAGDSVDSLAEITFVIDYWCERFIPVVNFTIHVCDEAGRVVFRLSTWEQDKPVSCESGQGSVACTCEYLGLLPGVYSLTVGASTPPGFKHLDVVERALVFTVKDVDFYGTGRNIPAGVYYVRNTWTKR